MGKIREEKILFYGGRIAKEKNLAENEHRHKTVDVR
jgi:hypothetical protein